MFCLYSFGELKPYVIFLKNVYFYYMGGLKANMIKNNLNPSLPSHPLPTLSEG